MTKRSLSASKWKRDSRDKLRAVQQQAVAVQPRAHRRIILAHGEHVHDTLGVVIDHGWQVRHHYRMRSARWAVATALGVLVTVVLGAQSAAPLPDQAHFFAEVQKRLASNDLIQSRYTYRERSTEVHMNPFGAMGTGAVLVYEVYPHPNDELTYRRLVEREGRRV